MRFTVIAVGKLKERFWTDACAEYLKRLRPYAPTTVVEVPDNGIEREAESVLRALDKLPQRTHVVMMAIEGKQLSSPQVSARIDELGLKGTSDLAFIIGGSDGLDARVQAVAAEAWSFGKITLPHNLARVVLLEQLYRACKISRGEPYHK